MSILTLFPLWAYSFTNPLISSFKDPAHEECRQWAQNTAYAGVALNSLSLLSYFVALTSDSIPAVVGITLPAACIQGFGLLFL